jgi:deoxyxylulose-5-phosphate synthase
MKHQIIMCGIPDEFIEHASRAEMLEMTGLDKKGILAKIKDSLS